VLPDEYDDLLNAIIQMLIALDNISIAGKIVKSLCYPNKLKAMIIT
jgi:hypothetical protein